MLFNPHRYKIVFLVLFVVFIGLITLTLLFTIPADAKLTDYLYYQNHTITGSTSGAVSYYPMEFWVYRGIGTSNGFTIYLQNHVRNWPFDMTITDNNGNVMPYTIEKYDSNSAVIWVNMSYLPASPNTTSITFYYGLNNGVGDSSANNVFPLYDGFTGTSLNSTLWNTAGGPTINVSGGTAAITGPASAWGGILSKGSYGPHYRIRYSATSSFLSGINTQVGGGNDVAMYPSDSFETYLTYAGSTWDLQTVHSGYTDAPFSVITYPPTSYHTFELQWRTDSLVKQYVDGNYLLSNTLNVPTSAPYVIAAAYGGGTVTLDWIAAFPVLEYEPTHSTWYTEHYNRANITMPVRHYFPGNDTYYTEQLSINPAETCLVVMDPWGSHEDPLGVPRLVANMNNYLLRLINVTRDYGIQIVYTNYNSAHYIYPIVGPCVGDKVWQGSDTEPSLSSFTTYLNSLQLKYIIYSGYHTNYCVIGRPMGMNATSVLTGYRILAVRDCTVAYEGALEPLDFGPEYNWSIKYIESSLGGTTTFSQVMAAFGEDELNFTATPTSGAASLAVDFSAYYNGTIPDTFEWYYGDGVHENTSIATAHHTYGSAGSYTVTANTYFNNSKLGNATKTNYITVSEPTPTPTPAPTPTPEPVLPPEIIDFTGTPTSGEVPLTTSWSCITTGSTPLTYAWSWGDSTANGTTANPSHTYTEAGTYTVILTVTNSAGSNSSVKNNMIVVQAAAAPTTPPDETEDTSFQLGLSGWTLIIFGLIIVALIAIVGFVILRAATGEGDNNMVLPVVVLAIVIIAAIMIGLKIMGGITGL